MMAETGLQVPPSHHVYRLLIIDIRGQTGLSGGGWVSFRVNEVKVSFQGVYGHFMQN